MKMIDALAPFLSLYVILCMNATLPMNNRTDMVIFSDVNDNFFDKCLDDSFFDFIIRFRIIPYKRQIICQMIKLLSLLFC